MNSNINVLLACKNSDESILIKQKIQSQTADVSTTESKSDLLKILSHKNIDILILDLVHQDFDAIMLLRELKEAQIQIPYTIILSDRTEEFVHTMAFESGADDIILKPVKPTFLNARINAIIRREHKLVKQDDIINDTFYLDAEKYLVIKKFEKIYLGLKEFELLMLFYLNPGKIFSRTEIIEQIWGEGGLSLASRNIDIHVRKLRLKIGYELIKSVKGVGYGLAYSELTAHLFKDLEL